MKSHAILDQFIKETEIVFCIVNRLEDVDVEMSVNPYAVYDEILANKQYFDLQSIENSILTIDNLLNYAKTDLSFLDEKTKQGLIEKRAELVNVAKDKGSTKY